MLGITNPRGGSNRLLRHDPRRWVGSKPARHGDRFVRLDDAIDPSSRAVGLLSPELDETFGSMSIARTPADEVDRVE